jgi:hypothetical protein
MRNVHRYIEEVGAAGSLDLDTLQPLFVSRPRWGSAR